MTSRDDIHADKDERTMQEDQFAHALDRVFTATDSQVEQLQTMTYEQLLVWATQNSGEKANQESK